jgi:hypothetical protein
MRMLSLAVVLCFASPSQAAFINFGHLAIHDALDNHTIGPVYTSGGFVLRATADPAFMVQPDFNFNGTLSNISPGSTALFHHISGGEITLTRADGGTFNFTSIALAELPNRNEDRTPFPMPSFSIAFTGTFADGSTVTEYGDVNRSTFLTLKTNEFSAFRDVVSVTWFQGTGGSVSPAHQFDSLAVEATPAPSSLVLAMIGAGVLGLLYASPARARLTSAR